MNYATVYRAAMSRRMHKTARGPFTPKYQGPLAGQTGHGDNAQFYYRNDPTMTPVPASKLKPGELEEWQKYHPDERYNVGLWSGNSQQQAPVAQQQPRQIAKSKHAPNNVNAPTPTNTQQAITAGSARRELLNEQTADQRANSAYAPFSVADAWNTIKGKAKGLMPDPRMPGAENVDTSDAVPKREDTSWPMQLVYGLGAAGAGALQGMNEAYFNSDGPRMLYSVYDNAGYGASAALGRGGGHTLGAAVREPAYQLFTLGRLIDTNQHPNSKWRPYAHRTASGLTMAQELSGNSTVTDAVSGALDKSKEIGHNIFSNIVGR